jgi:hypothetical protein
MVFLKNYPEYTKNKKAYKRKENNFTESIINDSNNYGLISERKVLYGKCLGDYSKSKEKLMYKPTHAVIFTGLSKK